MVFTQSGSWLSNKALHQHTMLLCRLVHSYYGPDWLDFMMDHIICTDKFKLRASLEHAALSVDHRWVADHTKYKLSFHACFGPCVEHLDHWASTLDSAVLAATGILPDKHTNWHLKDLYGSDLLLKVQSSVNNFADCCVAIIQLLICCYSCAEFLAL